MAWSEGFLFFVFLQEGKLEKGTHYIQACMGQISRGCTLEANWPPPAGIESVKPLQLKIFF